MNHLSDRSATDGIRTSLRFFENVGLRSEAYLKGDDWVRSRLADLKIDLWLATEHGEAEGTQQVEIIHQQIETLSGVLRKSVFDPDPKDLRGSLPIEIAAADLARYVLHIAKQEHDDGTTFSTILSSAEHYMNTTYARSEAHACMERVRRYCGIVFEDVAEVISSAKHLLACCR